MFFGFTAIMGCEDNDIPVVENAEEIITDVTLTFVPVTPGLATVTATATDPDGEGPESIVIVSDAVLLANTEYDLSISIENSVSSTDIAAEVVAEGVDHMIFFEFANDVFSSPLGNGNMDNRTDAVNYSDTDLNGLPIGVETNWTTGNAISGATFRVVLKHQPGIKTSTTTSLDGATDIDLTWPLTIN